MCSVYFYVLLLYVTFFGRIFYENNRHIFQKLKNRIMGEKGLVQGWDQLKYVMPY